MATNPSRASWTSPLDPDELRARAEELRWSIAPDLYTPRVYVPWEEIEQTVDRLRPAADVLQEIADSGTWDPAVLAAALREPEVLTVVRHVLITPAAVGFADGSELPVDTPRTERQALRLAGLLLEIGLPRLLPPPTRVVDVLRVGTVALDSRRRGFRRRDVVEAEVRDLLRSAVADVRNDFGFAVALGGRNVAPQKAASRLDQVVLLDDRPIAGVTSFFAAQTGGRQQRLLMTTFPDLQRELDNVPMALVLIVDGRGVQEAPTYVLEHLLRSVGACMSRSEARSGGLAQALAAAAERKGSRPGRHVSVDLVIRSVLEREPEVSGRELPIGNREAVVALVEFKTAQPDLALDFDPARSALVWSRPNLVRRAQRLRHDFVPADAVAVLSDALSMSEVTPLPMEEARAGTAVVGGLVADPVLPARLVVGATQGAPDRKAVRAVARLNRQHAAGGAVAMLLVPELGSIGAPALAALQRQLATSVVVLDANALLDVAAHVRPRDALIASVLQQADLTKANPFTSTGATPPEMFFGREEEEASLLAILDSNSAALIGGRRIGKTSLLRHAVGAMIDAGWNAQYADCQAVGDWADFVRHVRPRWDIDLPLEFEPAHLHEMAQQLTVRAPGKLVVLLDEVDNLLKWDESLSEGRVSEAFFRACRALSQEGIAQFVFSGERRIARKLWDAGSPHWNFCMPIVVRQLSRRAADLLVQIPLRALGVSLSPSTDVLDLAWARSDGHPQILQELGTRVVHELNQLAPEKRGRVEPDLLDSLTSTASFARHYVETYWGQAAPLERLLTALIALDRNFAFEDLRVQLTALGIPHDAGELSEALQMLTLYGIVDDEGSTPSFRARHFPHALEMLGGAAAVIDDHVEACQGKEATIG